jgi:Hemerythrin HHE cation binding domain
MKAMSVYALGCAAALLAAPAVATPQEPHGDAAHGGIARIPESMRAEHEEIHSELVAAAKLKGRVGDAARELAEALHPHFVREEEIALPPLGLLAPLSRAPPTPEMRQVLAMTDALRAEMPKMLAEHRSIAAAARKLERVARAERNAKVEKLAQKLQLHARSEEEIFYPAALLVGEVVRGRG